MATRTHAAPPAAARTLFAAPVIRQLVHEKELEQILVDCLLILAQAAGEGGQSQRSACLADAARVLAATPHDDGPQVAGSRPAAPLTGRQSEVAALVARGLTNRQVARILRISERTAQTHVQNILSRLGFTCRTQIAMWHAQRESRSAWAGAITRKEGQ